MNRCAFLVLCMCSCAASRAADWPRFLGPTRDGVSTEKGLIATWDKKGPPLVWKCDVGEGYSGPVVAGGRVVLLHRVGKEEVVSCFNTDDGNALWKHAYACAYEDPYSKGNGPRATPIIADDRVYSLGAAGMLSCLKLTDGKLIWQRDLAHDYRLRKSFFGVGSTPLIEGDLLVANVGAADAGIVAFDKSTGKQVWKATNHEAGYSSPVAVTADGVRHLLFFTREGLVSLDPANGNVRFSKHWRSRMNASVNAATPLVVGDTVFVTASYNTGAGLFKMKKDSLSEVWSNDETLSCHFNTPVVVEGNLYGIDGRQEEGPRLRCVEWKTGKVRWSVDNFGCASIIVADGRLIVVTESGDLVLAAVSPKKYTELARASLLKGPCRAHPALANGRLYVRDQRQLTCWDLRKK